MRITKDLIDEIVAHAREDAPNECCGVLGGRDGEATRVIRVANELASPYSFRMHPQEQYDALKEVEQSGGDLVAIYHSHTRSAARPSQTDINESMMWPDQVQVIVSLEDPEDPDIRGFWIRDGKVEEEDLDIG